MDRFDSGFQLEVKLAKAAHNDLRSVLRRRARKPGLTV
jgi:hypothetical protein